jgi:hypothetical protein
MALSRSPENVLGIQARIILAIVSFETGSNRSGGTLGALTLRMGFPQSSGSASFSYQYKKAHNAR